MAKAILRVGKHTSMRSVSGIGRHVNRARPTPNADQEKWASNASWMPGEGWAAWGRRAPENLHGQLKDRLSDFERRGGTIRKDSVLAIELMLSASPEWFKTATKEQMREWLQRNTDWLADTFGAANVLQIALHLDETTPHLHAFVIPEVEMVETRGRKPKGGAPGAVKAPKPALAASRWLDGRAKLGELQDRYAAAMEPLGLERGLKGSKAKHRTIRSYYAAAESVMGRQPASIRIPAPPPLPEPVGVKEAAMAAAGFVPRIAAEATVKCAAQQAARAAAQQAQQQAAEARAAAIEAVQQRRQLLDRLEAIGGVDGVERVEELEQQLQELRRQQAEQLASLRHQLSQVRGDLDQALAERDQDARYIQELRRWGQEMADQAQALERELYGEPDSGLSFR